MCSCTIWGSRAAYSIMLMPHVSARTERTLCRPGLPSVIQLLRTDSSRSRIYSLTESLVIVVYTAGSLRCEVLEDSKGSRRPRAVGNVGSVALRRRAFSSRVTLCHPV